MDKKRVLVIEDDEQLQFVLCKRLQLLGLETISVFTVEQALKEIEAHKPDLILLDLGFKNTDGTALLMNMKRSQANNPPVIVMSGHNDREIVNFCKEHGATDFIAKPFQSEKLIKTILNRLHGSNSN